MKCLFIIISLMVFTPAFGVFLSLAPFAPYFSDLPEGQRQEFWTMYTVSGGISMLGVVVFVLAFVRSMRDL